MSVSTNVAHKWKHNDSTRKAISNDFKYEIYKRNFFFDVDKKRITLNKRVSKFHAAFLLRHITKINFLHEIDYLLFVKLFNIILFKIYSNPDYNIDKKFL